MDPTLSTYEGQLLAGWEEIYKRGQLTLWILLALYDGPKHMSLIKDYIQSHTGGMLTADDQSMYRALRRYDETELVTFKSEQAAGGPDRKMYKLTKTGENVLAQFVKRDIAVLLHEPMIKKIMEDI
ncbi:MAG TPA: PadR family transcriptional regulator [Candidatus Saccharimonadales bacterium]